MDRGGFNAFSFKNLQHEVGIKTSSVHYYFPVKTDLANAVVERFFARHKQALAFLESHKRTPTERFNEVAKFFIMNAKKGELCLGGMLTSDLGTLDPKARDILSEFFEHFEGWIEKQIRAGQKSGAFSQKVDPSHTAKMFVAMLEGGMLIARVKNKPDYYKKLVKQFIEHMQ